MMSASARAFLVDDQPEILKALARLLLSAGLETQTFESAQQFLNSGNLDAAGCLVLDLTMPGMNGLTLQQRLTDHNSILPIIFLTGNGDIDTSVLAMKLGAADFLTKPVDDARLIDAVRSAFEKNRVMRLYRAEHDDILERFKTLTPREVEVMHGVIDGKLNKQIASDLHIAEKTVKVHRARVMTKMKVDSVASLVRLTALIAK